MHFFQSSYKEVNVNEIVVLAICAEFYDNSNLNTPLLKKMLFLKLRNVHFAVKEKKKKQKSKNQSALAYRALMWY